ncbi:TPA: hypothetical protein QCV86_002990 [Bacillus thuringiensis]|nr:MULTISPECIES: hypothetical protein [Bacillus cereus group]MCU5013263.1 hypothetical protein [Bacillus cereus]MBU0451119.1 hypothetical protein [Bacillus thuringiensis]MCC3982603.1 hypothetical protein [Bacillus thuringiensis serovar kurstaki]MCR6840964.1 hypothetical protein [Bacillus thuringiensis]MDA2542916.1 hypothetical protein [Bacillus cereus]
MKKILAALIALSVTMAVVGNANTENASKQESSKQVYYMADPGGSVG